MSEPGARSESEYEPAIVVTSERSPRSQTLLSIVESVCETVSRFAPPLRVKRRSPTSKPTTGSENSMRIEVTEVTRGSGTPVRC